MQTQIEGIMQGNGFATKRIELPEGFGIEVVKGVVGTGCSATDEGFAVVYSKDPDLLDEVFIELPEPKDQIDRDEEVRVQCQRSGEWFWAVPGWDGTYVRADKIEDMIAWTVDVQKDGSFYPKKQLNIEIVYS